MTAVPRPEPDGGNRSSGSGHQRHRHRHRVIKPLKQSAAGHHRRLFSFAFGEEANSTVVLMLF